jgi:hypothetical protein
MSGKLTVPLNGGTVVTVEGFFDPNTGKAEWTFAGPDDLDDPFAPTPYRDFLPPNVNSPEGEGYVRYSVKPKAGLPTGTRIDNFATITFDEHVGGGPLETPPVFNTIDADAPSSAVESLDPVRASPTFTVNWGGDDLAGGSSLKDFSVYVSKDGAPFRPWLLFSSETTGSFTGEPGSSYAFFSLARDAAGNAEPLKTEAEATTFIIGLGDTDGDSFDDNVELYIGTDPLDACPDEASDDAWPLDIDRDKEIRVVTDVLNFGDRIGATPGSPNWWQRLDFNGDGQLSVVGDVLMYRGMIGETCT